MWMLPHTEKHIHHMCQKYDLVGGHLRTRRRKFDDYKCDIGFIFHQTSIKDMAELLMGIVILMTVSRWAPRWLGQRATRAIQATRTMPSLGRLAALHGEETSMDGKQVVFLEKL